MRKQQQKEPQQTHVILEQIQFQFPLIKPIGMVQQKAILTKQKKETKRPNQMANYFQRQQQPPTILKQFLKPSEQLQSKMLSYNYSIPLNHTKKQSFPSANTTNKKSFTSMHNKSELKEGPNQLVNDAHAHDMEKTLGGVSLSQISEFDKSEVLIKKLEDHYGNKQPLLPIIDEICEIDILDLKSLKIYSQIGIQLLTEIQKLNTNQSKPLALIIGIIEDLYFRNEADLTLALQFTDFLYKYRNSISGCEFLLAEFLKRVGLQIYFVKQNNFKSLSLLIMAIINYYLKINLPVNEEIFIKILRGINQIFRKKEIINEIQSQKINLLLPSSNTNILQQLILRELQLQQCFQNINANIKLLQQSQLNDPFLQQIITH